MDRSEYLYNAVKIVYSSMVQSTLAIENYFAVTIVPFNQLTLGFYDEFLDYYERSISNKGNGADKDSVLMFFLRANREETVRCALKYIELNIMKKAQIDSDAYDIIKQYSTYENNKKIGNPFEKIIVDLREITEQKFEKKEVINLRKIDIIWYDDDALSEIRANKMDNPSEDGELGGHLMQEKVSYDLGYLSTRLEREKLFREIVLGEKLNGN